MIYLLDEFLILSPPMALRSNPGHHRERTTLNPGFYATPKLAPKHFPANRDFLKLSVYQQKIDLERKAYDRKFTQKRTAFERHYGSYDNARRNLHFASDAEQAIKDVWKTGQENDKNRIDSLYKALYALCRSQYETAYSADSRIDKTTFLDQLTETHVLEVLCVLLQEKQTEEVFYKDHSVDVNSMAVNDVLEAIASEDGGPDSKIQVKRGAHILFVIDVNARAKITPSQRPRTTAAVPKSSEPDRRRGDTLEFNRDPYYQSTPGDVLLPTEEELRRENETLGTPGQDLLDQ